MEPTRKRSKKRDAILSCLCSTDTHPSAEWIYHRLKPQIPDLSLATVYRNLALFQREGRIISVGVVQNLERFDATQCGCVLDLPGLHLPQELEQEAAQMIAGQVRRSTLCFEGLCPACAQSSIPNHPVEESAG